MILRRTNRVFLGFLSHSSFYGEGTHIITAFILRQLLTAMNNMDQTKSNDVLWADGFCIKVYLRFGCPRTLLKEKKEKDYKLSIFEVTFPKNFMKNVNSSLIYQADLSCSVSFFTLELIVIKKTINPKSTWGLRVSGTSIGELKVEHTLWASLRYCLLSFICFLFRGSQLL